MRNEAWRDEEGGQMEVLASPVRQILQQIMMETETEMEMDATEAMKIEE